MPTSVDVRQLGLFMAHIVVLITGVVSLSPLNRLMAWKAFFVCLRTALVAQAGKVGFLTAWAWVGNINRVGRSAVLTRTWLVGSGFDGWRAAGL